jgi:hypothetical protein
LAAQTRPGQSTPNRCPGLRRACIVGAVIGTWSTALLSADSRPEGKRS